MDEQRRPLIAEVVASFEQRVVPELERLPHQATHGDINPDNMVVDRKYPERIVGLFDFGDMSWGPA